MAKRNVAYIKPDEPAFLKRMKEQAGYKESYNVNSKREQLPSDFDDDDFDDNLEEQPTVVVLNAGDLTAEEAEEAKQKIEMEISQKPADLAQRVVFNKSVKSNKREKDEDNEKKKSKKSKSNKPVLSFNDEEED